MLLFNFRSFLHHYCGTGEDIGSPSVRSPRRNFRPGHTEIGRPVVVSFQHRGALVKLAFLVNSRVFDRYIEVVEFVYKATYHWEVAKKGPSKRDQKGMKG